MKKEVSALEIREKAFQYIKEYTKSKELDAKFMKLCKEYDTLFSTNSAFMKILEKAHLANGDGISVKLSPIKNEKYLRTSIFSSIGKNFKIYTEGAGIYSPKNRLGIFPKSEFEEYSIQFDSSGTVSLITYYKNGMMDASSSSFLEEIFLLNLPILICNIMQKKEGDKAKLQLENMVIDNPTSLMGTIYDYIKKNPKAIALLMKDLDELDSFTIGMTSKLLTSYNQVRLDNNFTTTMEEDRIPYLIAVENKTPLIKFDFENGQTKEYHFLNNGEYFPALIAFKSKEISLSYLRRFDFDYFNSSSLYKKKPEPLKLNSYNLIEKNKKIEEKVYDEKMKYENDLRTWEEANARNNYKVYRDIMSSKPPEKNWKYVKNNISKKIEQNINNVISTFLDFMENSSPTEQVAIQEKEIKNVEYMLEECKKKENEIASILRNLYKCEILISNL